MPESNCLTSATRPFRLAIVGAGLAAENLHLPAALASELVEVAAIVVTAYRTGD